MFSVVIDLSRLMMGFQSGDSAPAGKREEFFKCLFKASEWDGTWSLPLSKTKQTNILLLLRTIANAFPENALLNEGAWVKQVIATQSASKEA